MQDYQGCPKDNKGLQSSYRAGRVIERILVHAHRQLGLIILLNWPAIPKLQQPVGAVEIRHRIPTIY